MIYIFLAVFCFGWYSVTKYAACRDEAIYDNMKEHVKKYQRERLEKQYRIDSSPRLLLPYFDYSDKKDV